MKDILVPQNLSVALWWWAAVLLMRNYNRLIVHGNKCRKPNENKDIRMKQPSTTEAWKMTLFFFLPSVLWFRLPCQPGTHSEDLLVCRVQSGDISPRGPGLAGGGGRCHGHPRGQAQIYGHAQSDLLPPGVLWLSATHGRRGESKQTSFSLCRVQEAAHPVFCPLRLRPSGEILCLS